MATKENEENNKKGVPEKDPERPRRRKKSSIRVPPCFDQITDAAPPMPIPVRKISVNKPGSKTEKLPRKNSMNSNYNSCLIKFQRKSKLTYVVHPS